jgi:hypothetical protein
MTNTVAELHRPEDLLLGSLASLAASGYTTLRTTDRSFHEHFTRALDVFKDAGGLLGKLAGRYYIDIVSNTYDELDHALIAAEQYRFVGFPNPSYNRLQIKMTPKAAQTVLHEWPAAEQEVFKRAAQALKQSIEK